MSSHEIAREKVEQAIGILREKNVDAWITFVRETPLMRDPTMDLIVGPTLNMTWHSAFILTAEGDRIAIVGRFDKENVEHTGSYRQVIAYDQGIRQPLVDTLRRLDPQSIAINYSESDPAADGLSHGMWTTLLHDLQGTPYATRLISAEDVVNALRGRKTATEIACITDAVAETEAIFDEVTAYLKPGLTEIEIRRVRPRSDTGARPDQRVGLRPLPDAGRRSPLADRARGAERREDRARPPAANRFWREQERLSCRICSAYGTS